MQHTSRLTLVAALCVLSSVAHAQAAAEVPDVSTTFNVGVASEYRYRGVSQSSAKPALQGGADIAFKSGAYLGTWASTISWIKNSTKPAVAKGDVEIDLYGGYKGDIKEGLSYDIGGLYYLYAGNSYDKVSTANANTFELYGALTAGVFTLKYSQSTTNLFGTANSKGSGYLDASATFDLGDGWSVVPHVGAQTIKNLGSYSDYALTVNKDIDGLVISASVLGTNRKGQWGTEPGSGKDLYRDGVVLSIKKNF